MLQKKEINYCLGLLVFGLTVFTFCPLSQATVAVWCDGDTSGCYGSFNPFYENHIITYLDEHSISYQRISTSDLEGDLSGYSTIIATRKGTDYGASLSNAAAQNVYAYVSNGGRAAAFTFDAFDTIGTFAVDGQDTNIEQLVGQAIAGVKVKVVEKFEEDSPFVE